MGKRERPLSDVRSGSRRRENSNARLPGIETFQVVGGRRGQKTIEEKR